MSEPRPAPDPVGYTLTWIDNETLRIIAEAGERAKAGDTISEAEAALLVHGAAPIARELLARRRTIETLHQLTEPNVIRLFDAPEAGK